MALLSYFFIVSALKVSSFLKDIYKSGKMQTWYDVSWGESASLVLVGHPSSVGILIKIPCEIDVLLHQKASHPIFSYWVD